MVEKVHLKQQEPDFFSSPVSSKYTNVVKQQNLK